MYYQTLDDKRDVVQAITPKRTHAPGRTLAGAVHRTSMRKRKPFVPPPAHDLNAPRRAICINSSGQASCRTVSRTGLVEMFGVAHRDVRFIDPTIPTAYPAAILIREKALVVNLESIRMVISPTKVLVLSMMHQLRGKRVDCAERQDMSCGFIADLQRRLRPKPPAWRSAPTARSRTRRQWGAPELDVELPYELRALEGALAEGMRLLEEEGDLLEERCLPAVEAMARQLTLQNLEAVRECKRELTSLGARITRLRTVLDDILEDDDDMADMYLARRKEEQEEEEEEEEEEGSESGAAAEDDKAAPEGRQQQQHAAAASVRSTTSGRSQAAAAPRDRSSPPPVHDSAGPPHAEEASTLTTTSSAPATMPAARTRSQVEGADGILGMLASRKGSGALGGVMLGGASGRDIEGVENMLETYMMQVEFLESRVQSMKERIDDTEDLVNIDLDNRRNDIVLVNLIATSVSIVFAFVTSIAGVFGMNLRSGLEGSSTAFVVVTVLSFVMGFFILGGLILWYRLRGLTFIPDSKMLS